jgi:hypothetical protein
MSLQYLHSSSGREALVVKGARAEEDVGSVGRTTEGVAGILVEGAESGTKEEKPSWRENSEIFREETPVVGFSGAEVAMTFTPAEGPKERAGYNP